MVVVYKFLYKCQNLCLDRYIEGCRGLVGNKELRLTCKGDGYDDSLLHSTGKLVRIVIGTGSRDTYHLQHFLCLFHCLFLRNFIVETKAFCNLVTDGDDRIQCRHRILEDHSHIVSPHFLQFRFTHCKNISTFQHNGTATDYSRWVWNKVENTHGCSGLTRSCFTHQAQGLFLSNRE